jgi:hypothetical protein
MTCEEIQFPLNSKVLMISGTKGIDNMFAVAVLGKIMQFNGPDLREIYEIPKMTSPPDRVLISVDPQQSHENPRVIVATLYENKVYIGSVRTDEVDYWSTKVKLYRDYFFSIHRSGSIRMYLVMSDNTLVFKSEFSTTKGDTSNFVIHFFPDRCKLVAITGSF